MLERIVDETRGNPLALLELPRGLNSAQLAGGFGLPATVPLSAGIEEGYARRLRGFLRTPGGCCWWPPPIRWAIRRWCGGRPSGSGSPSRLPIPSNRKSCWRCLPRVVFRHPLVRSAVYGAAGVDERREVHRALADATDPDSDPDRRAWHRAQAAATPDEEVAAELEHSAGRAQARGGFAAAAAFLERAVALSPDPSHRAQRALAAAQSKFQAGALDDALDLLDTAESGIADDDPVRAQVHLCVPKSRSRRSAVATRPRCCSRQRVSSKPLTRAWRGRRTSRPSRRRCSRAGSRGAAGMVEAGEAALAGPPMPSPPRPSDLLLQGFAVQATQGYAAAAPILKDALSAYRREVVPSPEDARWLWLASWIALHLWDDASWSVLSARQLELVRRTGALSVLPFALSNRSSVYAFLGDLRTAAVLEEELRAVIEATGIADVSYGRLTLAALRGREDDFSELVRSMVGEARTRGEGVALTVAEFLSGTLYNGLGRYETALAAVAPAERFYTEAPAIWALTELIEAAVRCGQPERARRAFERVQETTAATGTDWGLGIEARCRALISEGDDAEVLYQEALERLGRTRIRVQLARTHLLYGEWLRRERRRLDAREQLRTAYQRFKDFGVEAFAERARVELEATGERARKRAVETLDQLTPQEAQIARLAAEGETNREIAARLFISASTVEYHLRKAFRKLDVKSRTQLANRLS